MDDLVAFTLGQCDVSGVSRWGAHLHLTFSPSPSPWPQLFLPASFLAEALTRERKEVGGWEVEGERILHVLDHGWHHESSKPTKGKKQNEGSISQSSDARRVLSCNSDSKHLDMHACMQSNPNQIVPTVIFTSQSTCAPH